MLHSIIEVLRRCFYATTTLTPTAMSAPRSLSALTRSRLGNRAVNQCASVRPAFAATFSTSSSRQATTGGAPPAGFRLPRPVKWNERKDSVWDQAANYFLFTEMARGMWVLLEQFFRPPYVFHQPKLARPHGLIDVLQLHNLLPLRKRSHLAPL